MRSDRWPKVRRTISEAGFSRKRLNDNRHRSIILARAGQFWVYEYLFPKQDRANIDEGKLVAFRQLAKAYAALNDRQVEELLRTGQFKEICNDDPA